MVKKLAWGWTPERDEEFQRLDALEGHATDAGKTELAEQEPRVIDHYLYFPKKSNAERAAQRLRAKDWAVEVKRGADGENWLTLAKQPAPIEDDVEEIRDELERLAEELGGEYDGWGAAVKRRTRPPVELFYFLANYLRLLCVSFVGSRINVRSELVSELYRTWLLE